MNTPDGKDTNVPSKTPEEIKEGSRVVVKSYPLEEIIGLTGTVKSVDPISHFAKNMVKFDIPLDPSGCEYFWFADEDLEVIE